MELVTENSLSKDMEEKLTVTTSGDAKQKGITEDTGKSSKKSEIASTSLFIKQSNYEGSSSSKGISRNEPISTDFRRDVNETYDRECVVLKCENNEEVSVPVPLVIQSGMIRHALDVGLADNCIPIPTLPVSVLEMMMEYWKMHVGEAGFDEERRKDMYQWENKYFTRIGPDALYDLLEAANYMDARGVLERGAEYVAELIKKMSVDEIRVHFGMKNDFTPEEEEQIKKDFPWAN